MQQVNKSALLPRCNGEFAGRLLSGLAALLALAGHARADIPPRQETDSLRGDFVRLGSGMHAVMTKEQRGEKATR